MPAQGMADAHGHQPGEFEGYFNMSVEAVGSGIVYLVPG
jgi:hypothetical protein